MWLLERAWNCGPCAGGRADGNSQVRRQVARSGLPDAFSVPSFCASRNFVPLFQARRTWEYRLARALRQVKSRDSFHKSSSLLLFVPEEFPDSGFRILPPPSGQKDRRRSNWNSLLLPLSRTCCRKEVVQHIFESRIESNRLLSRCFSIAAFYAISAWVMQLKRKHNATHVGTIPLIKYVHTGPV